MSNQIELRHLRYFLAVANHLHFRNAAESLFISQPGLTRQIKQLEEELGYPLFERNNKNVKLTNAGAYLFDELRLIMNTLGKTLSHGKLIHAGFSGHLKIGYVGSAIKKIIPELLVELRNQNAGIQFDLEEMSTPLQIENLQNQLLDLGFARLNRVPKGLIKVAVLEENFVLVLPNDHSLSEENYKDISQLKDESFILFKPSFSQAYFEKVMQIFDDSGFYPKIAHNSVSIDTIFNIVANNFGVSIIPRSMRNDTIEALKFIELDKIPQRTTLFLVYNEANRNPLLTPVLKYFINESN